MTPPQPRSTLFPYTTLFRSSDQKWWPSKWGATDELGASNHMTPQKVLEAAKWIRDGKVYKLGRVYEQGMPLFGAEFVDRKSTRLNSSHTVISYAVFCLKKKK